MPRSAGNYTLPSGNPVVTGTQISSTTHNTTMSDIATEITNSLPRDGTAPPLANIPMGTNKLTGLGAGSALTDSANYTQVQNQAYAWLTSVAGTNTITASVAPAITAYAAGQTFRFVAAGANTGAVTLNINSVGAKAVTQTGTVVLGGGEFVSGAVIEVTYDGTRFQVTGMYLSATDLQEQAFTKFTTAGTSTAFTLTPTPALGSLVTGARFHVTFNAASGATPTLAVSGLTAKNLKYYDTTGAKQAITSSQVPSGWVSDVEYDGTDWVVLDIPPTNTTDKIQPITASVGASAMTVTLNPTSLDFRSATIGSGTVNTRVIGTAISVVIPSTATMGTVNAVPHRLALLAIDDAGTVELAVCNSNCPFSEDSLITTTTIDTAADSASVIYSTTGRSNVPFRLVGFVDSTQATAGTWATSPSIIQGAGGFIHRVVQSVSFQTGAVATTTGVIPYDDTIPQSGEGAEFMSLAITPKSAGNILDIEISFNCSHSTAGYTAIVALFQDATANALAAGTGFVGSTRGSNVTFRHRMVAGTTSATTFKVRAGPSDATTLTFNGAASARIFGGVMASSIRITEMIG